MTDRHPFEVNGNLYFLSIPMDDPSDPPYRILDAEGMGLSTPWHGFDRHIAQLEAQRAKIEETIQIHKAAKRKAQEVRDGLV